MVIMQEILEKVKEYRGSKSITCLIPIDQQESVIVKEQRVDGSWVSSNKSSRGTLRCTLMGFERNYQVKIPSNLIIQRRPYFKGFFKDNNKHTTLIEPWFISGFTDAEGCFAIIVRKSPKTNLSWRLEINFIINLHKRDLDLLKLIQTYFKGAGRIGKERNGCCDFTVSSLGDILTKVIPLPFGPW